jgi:2',3'-cyclic-nucleotide 2'-phosphodiesterase (5'-nucleotidase family)
VLVLLAVGAAAAGVPVSGDGPFQVTLFHTNDIHGSFLPEPATWRPDKAEVGGFVALARHLAAERRTAAAACLLVDGGDFMTGDPVTAIASDGVVGVAMAELMNLSGYDVGVIGNHEFDAGRANIARLAESFGYPLLAADLADTLGRPAFRAQPVILERGGLRIAVLGVSCAELRDLCPPSRISALELRDQAAVVQAQLADLVPRTDLQVLISHDGIEGDRALARGLAAAGLDVIVGAHSHTRLEEPQVVEGVVIVQAGSNLKNLGRLDLTLANGSVTTYRGGLVELTAAGGDDAVPPALAAAVDRYRREVETVYGERVGELTATWRRNSRGESNLGSWICEAMRARAGTDVALLNSGGLRKDLPPGPITLLDIHQMLPFANELVVVELAGADLRRVAQANAQAAADGSYGILQVAGLAYAYRERAGAVELVETTVGGEPLRDDRIYSIALPDYVAVMSHVYLADLKLPPYREVGATLCGVMVDAVRAAREPITSVLDGRMRRIEDGSTGGR